MPRNLSILLHSTAVHCPTAQVYLFILTPTLSRHPVYSSVRSATVPYSMQGTNSPKISSRLVVPSLICLLLSNPLALCPAAFYSKLKMEPFRLSYHGSAAAPSQSFHCGTMVSPWLDPTYFTWYWNRQNNLTLAEFIWKSWSPTACLCYWEI